MNVLHLHSGNLFGGLETSLLAWMTAAREVTPDWHHGFVLAWQGAFSQGLTARGISFELLPSPPRFSRPWSLCRSRRQVKEIIDRQNPDLVVVHGFWQASALLPGGLKVPVVLWVNDVPSPGDLLAWLASQRHFSLVIAPSIFVTNLCRNILSADRFETVPCLVPLKERENQESLRKTIRQQSGVKSGEKVILQVGRMYEGKGHRELLRAVAQLGTRDAWQLWVVGGAQSAREKVYESALKRLVEGLHLESRVKFWGQQKDVSPFFAGADIYCQLHQNPESFGVVFVEALQARLPVVTHNRGGESEIFSRAPGFLVNPDEPNSAVEILQRLIEDDAFLVESKSLAAQSDLSFTEPSVQSQKIARLLASLLDG